MFLLKVKLPRLDALEKLLIQSFPRVCGLSKVDAVCGLFKVCGNGGDLN